MLQTRIHPTNAFLSHREARGRIRGSALLRDVSFIDYPNNPIVAQAVADMNNLSFVQSGNV
jgi:hypothetical protein